MKVAIITGAASGIGLALSQVCLHRGITTVMVDKNHSRLAEESSHLKKQFPHLTFDFNADVTQMDEVNQLVLFVTSQFGRVDWIYNNAGIIGKLAPLWELESADINEVMDVNLMGMFNMIKAFIPFLFEQSFTSHLINMASLYALCSGSQLAPYSMSKHALLALSESLHFDLKRLGKPVDLSIVFPSFTNTSLLSDETAKKTSTFQTFLDSLLTHSRQALEVAEYIVKAVECKQFYILPDKEVKNYCSERIQALILQENPHINNVEQLMNSLIKRKNRSLSSTSASS